MSNAKKLVVIRALFWMHFISAVLVPFYTQWGGLELRHVLLLNAWFMVWNFLLEIPTGTIADRFGRRSSLVLGGLAAAAGAVLYTSAPTLPRFLVAEIVFAAAFTLMSGADEALLYDSLVEDSEQASAPRWYGLLASAQQIGIVTGALLGSLIAIRFGVRAPLLFQALPMAAAGLLALSLREVSSNRSETRPSYRAIMTIGVRHFLGSGPLLRLTADMVWIGALTWLVIWLYQPALERVGVALAWFGLVHTGMSLAQIAFFQSVGRATALIGSRRLLRLSPLVAGLCFLGLATRAPWWCVIPLIIVAAGFGLSRPPLYLPHLNRHIESEVRATVLSTVTMIRTAVIAAVNLIAGAFADRSLPVVFATAGALLLLGAVFSPIEESDLAN